MDQSDLSLRFPKLRRRNIYRKVNNPQLTQSLDVSTVQLTENNQQKGSASPELTNLIEENKEYFSHLEGKCGCTECICGGCRCPFTKQQLKHETINVTDYNDNYRMYQQKKEVSFKPYPDYRSKFKIPNISSNQAAYQNYIPQKLNFYQPTQHENVQVTNGLRFFGTSYQSNHVQFKDVPQMELQRPQNWLQIIPQLKLTSRSEYKEAFQEKNLLTNEPRSLKRKNDSHLRGLLNCSVNFDARTSYQDNFRKYSSIQQVYFERFIIKKKAFRLKNSVEE